VAIAIKVDLFVLGESPLDQEQMDRRQRIRVASDPERHLYVYAPGDILLQKLRRFRAARRGLGDLLDRAEAVVEGS
jgi:hypothetical protein